MHFVTIISALISAALAVPGRDYIRNSARNLVELHPVSTANQPRDLAARALPASQTSHGSPRHGSIALRRIIIGNMEYLKYGEGTTVSIRLTVKDSHDYATAHCRVYSSTRPSSLNAPCNRNDIKVSFSGFDAGDRSYRRIVIQRHINGEWYSSAIDLQHSAFRCEVIERYENKPVAEDTEVSPTSSFEVSIIKANTPISFAERSKAEC